MSDPRTLIETICRRIVEQPESIEVLEHPENGGVLIEVNAAQDDIGRLVGRKGRTAHAMRTLLRAASDLDRTRYSLDIVS